MNPSVADAIVVRFIDLDGAGAQLDALDVELGLLTAAEHSQAAIERLPTEVRRRRARARVFLRWVLLDGSKVPAARGGVIEQDANGKPFLPGAPTFNVSHSGPLCVVAVASGGPIGVDVELPRAVHLGPERQALIIAAAVGLSPSGGENALPFLAAWTRLEALAKARGDGVGWLLTALGITSAGVRTSSAADVTNRARTIAQADGLVVAALDLPGGSFGAVAGPAGLIPQGVVCQPVTTEDFSRWSQPHLRENEVTDQRSRHQFNVAIPVKK